MKLYHAIIVCSRDAELVDWHMKHAQPALESIGQADCPRCLYYGIPLVGPAVEPFDCSGYGTHVVPFLDIYENLPLKTYGMLQHALTIPEWTHLLKADVNSYPTYLDPDAIQKHHLVGFYTRTHPGRTGHMGKVYQAGLSEPYMGTTPEKWCGGPAYVLSRLLATKIVDRGAWYARRWPWEDVMVSQIADECGWTAKPGVGYWTDGSDSRN